jgi:hypothetical protein
MHLEMAADRDLVSLIVLAPGFDSTRPRDLYPCSAHLDRLPDSGDKNREFHAYSRLGHTVVSDAMSPALQALLGYHRAPASRSLSLTMHAMAKWPGIWPEKRKDTLITRMNRRLVRPMLPIPKRRTITSSSAGTYTLLCAVGANRPKPIVIPTTPPTVQPASAEGFSAPFTHPRAAPPRYAPGKWRFSTPTPSGQETFYRQLSWKK